MHAQMKMKYFKNVSNSPNRLELVGCCTDAWAGCGLEACGGGAKGLPPGGGNNNGGVPPAVAPPVGRFLGLEVPSFF